MWPVDDTAFQALRHPDAVAAIDLSTAQQWTYRDLDRAVGQCVSLLRDTFGCAPGDRVATLAKNRVELVIIHLACARAGLMYVPLNWRLNRNEILALVEDCDPRLMIGDAEMARAGIDGIQIEHFASRRQACEPVKTDPIDPEHISLILYTSGTSGRPKGVLLSERAHRETAINFGQLGQVTAASAILIDTPMFHVIGLISSVRPFLMQGGCLLVSDGFDPARTLSRLADPALKATHYFCVPQMADKLRAEPGFDGGQLSNLTALFTGGAPHPAASIRSWLDAGVAVVDGYGMSEAGTVLGMSLDRQVIRAKAGAAGLPTQRLSLRIVDDAGNSLPAGVGGELQIKGPNLFSGYWRREAEAKAAYTEDGWFCTGDIACADADGYISIIDRKKDMFISGGENIYPAEIEALLASYPGLVEAAVIGVPDARWGEVGLCAMVHPDPPADLADQVRQHLSERLASYKLPRRFVVVSSLPRTGSGKVQKHELRDLVSQSAEAL